VFGTDPGVTITTPNSNVSTVTGLTAGTSVTLRWTIINGTCSSQDDVVLTNDKLPTGSLSGTTSICNGSSTSLTFTLTGTGPYDVDYTDGSSTFTLTGISNGATTSVSPSATKTYSITRIKDLGTLGGCSGSSFGSSATVTVNSIPSILVGQMKTICSGDAVNYKVTLTPSGTPSGTVYNWSAPTMSDASAQGNSGSAVPESNTLTITDVLTNTSSAAITATYNITPTGPAPTGCVGAQTAVVVTVNPLPSFNIVNNTSTICSGSTTDITLTTPTVNGMITLTTVNYGSATGGTQTTGNTYISGQKIVETLTNPGTSPITVSYTFSVAANGCSNPTTQSTTVTLNPTPVIMNLAPSMQATICSSVTLNFTPTSSISGTTYTWNTTIVGSITGVTTPVGSGPITDSPANSASTSGTVTYQITPHVGICAGLSRDYVVTVQPKPSAHSTPTTICSGSVASATIDPTPKNVLGTTYGWKIAPVSSGLTTSNVLGAIADNGSTISQTLTLTDSNVGFVTYKIVPTANSCNGDTINLKITVNPIATIQAVPISPVCQPSTISLTSNLGGAATQATWQVISGFGSITGANTPAGSATYNVSGISASDDRGTTVKFKVTTDDPVGPCPAVSDQISVRIDLAPTVQLPKPSDVFCEPSSVSLSGTVGGSGTGGVWSLSSAGGGTLSASTATTNVSANYLVSSSDITTPAKTLMFTLTSTNQNGFGSCPAATANYNVTVNQSTHVSIADINNQLMTQFAICQSAPGQGGSTKAGDFNAVITGAPLAGQITWSTNKSGTFDNPNIQSPIYNFSTAESPPLPPNNFPKQVVLTLAVPDPDGTGPGGGPCKADTTRLNVTINPLPTVGFTGLPASIGSNAHPVTLTGFQSGGVFSIQPPPGAIGSTGTYNGRDTVSFDPHIAVAGGTLNTVTYTYTDANTCTNSYSQGVIVNDPTSLKFTVHQAYPVTSGWELCADQLNSGLTTSLATGSIPYPPSPTSPSSSSYVWLEGYPDVATGVPGGSRIYESNTAGYIPSGNLHIIVSGGQYFLETEGLPAATYYITFDYLNASGVPNRLITQVVVHEAPHPKISLLTNCNAKTIDFTDQTTSSDPIQYVTWNFGDQNSKSSNTSPYSVQHQYSTPGVYNASLTVTSLISSTQVNGCTSVASAQVTIGQVPLVDFTASAFCTNDSTTFTDHTNRYSSKITSYHWDFGETPARFLNSDSTNFGLTWSDRFTNDSIPLNRTGVYPPWYTTNVPSDLDSLGGTFQNPRHHYDSAGNYFVKLTVQTNDGCTSTVTKKISIYKYSTIKPLISSAYREDFNLTSGNWQVESLNSTGNISWTWTTPNGKYITGPDKAWWTGLNVVKGYGTYSPTESSSVNGPCFNLTQLDRPMISFDYWVNTPNSNDGAAVQYSTDGGDTWTNIGAPLRGINWYSPALIVSNPGDQPVGFGPYGWSGPSQTGWLKGSFNLDAIPVTARDQVRIRVAFAGDESKNISDIFSGFAFDNVFVGEKTRNVLVEHFTNATQSGSRSSDNYFDNLFSAELNLRNGSSDFHDLQYHVRFPQADDVGQDNNDVSARALYYGVQMPPYSIMNGGQSGPFQTGNYSAINPVRIDSGALMMPRLDIISLDTTSLSGTYSNHMLSAKLTIKASSVDTITAQLMAQLVLVEDPVTINSTTYHNVVRKFIYGTGGDIKNVSLLPNGTLDFSKYNVAIDASINNPDSLHLVAFIQDYNTKEILQSAVFPVNRKGSKIVTAIHDPISSIENIRIYPNPANGKFIFGMPGGFPANAIWKIADQRGINVMSGDFNDAVNGLKPVEVNTLPNGVYFIAIGTPGNAPVYRKLVVLNEN
jgi:hypothetical protein